ncbi:MAG TPA: hypothetical protein VGG20_15535 [Thermoanaerobaculia bacterium]|jgi:hypothetical protein
MAIQIRAHLTATPNPTTLPRRIDFHQTLRSNQASEDVVAVYQLSSEIDVWFQDGNGDPTKTVQRDLTVTQAEQVFLVRIVLQTGAKAKPIALVEIDQVLTDSSGIKIPDSVVLQIG